MKKTRLALSLLLLSSALASPAFAQVNSADQARVDRLERDVQLLQRQLARGEPINIAPSAGGDNAGGPPSDSSLEVRMSTIEEQMRDLRGKNEENEFQIKKLSDTLEKMQKDNDFRFSELSAGKGAPAAPIEQPGSEPVRKTLPENDGGSPDKPTPIGKNDDIKPDTTGASTAGDGTLRLPEKTKDGKDGNFATPREHYNYAFRLLNQTQYEEAATSFDAFTKKYPKDPLVGNAFYWEGETFYIRRDYVNAADNFRQGFEALPDGPKAADNLLKLAMSLNALNRDKEACVVLQQIVTKFKKNSTSVTDKADQEQKRIGCH